MRHHLITKLSKNLGKHVRYWLELEVRSNASMATKSDGVLQMRELVLLDLLFVITVIYDGTAPFAFISFISSVQCILASAISGWP